MTSYSEFGIRTKEDAIYISNKTKSWVSNHPGFTKKEYTDYRGHLIKKLLKKYEKEDKKNDD